MIHWKRNITFFITGQMISFIGSLLVQFAIFWHINLETQSGFILSISIVASFLPLLLFSPFAGVWADRLPRKFLMITADLSIALVTLFVAILFTLGSVEIWVLIVVTFLRGVGQAIHGPAIAASIPLMVPEKLLMRVQGIKSGIESAFNVLAPVIAALLIANFDLRSVFYVDFITAMLGISTLLLFVRIPKHGREADIKEKGEGIRDFKAGLAYIKAHRFLIPFFIYLFIILVLVSPVAFLSPLHVVRDFQGVGTEYFRLTVVEVGFSSGMVIGSGIIAWWGGFKNRIFMAGLAISLLGIGVLSLGLWSNFYYYGAAMVFQGIVLPFYNTPTNVMIQEQVEKQYMGRVLSVMTMINSVAMPIGILIFGPLADLISIDSLMIGSGLAMIVFGMLYWLNQPMMRAGIKRSSDSSKIV
jgi:DHA3 family macrolide efflux protein-like MFS transporter